MKWKGRKQSKNVEDLRTKDGSPTSSSQEFFDDILSGKDVFPTPTSGNKGGRIKHIEMKEYKPTPEKAPRPTPKPKKNK